MWVTRNSFQRYWFLLAGLLVSCAATKTTVKESYENYENGKIKWYKRVKTVQNKHVSRDAFMRVTTEYRLYYENGTLATEWKLVEDAGSENTCRETWYELKQYYSNGNKQRSYKMQCDCHKEWERTYNQEGKLLTRNKSLIKRLH